MLKIPSTRMKPVTVAYRGLLKAPQMDAKAQWNLDGDIKFIETLNSTQNLRYYVLKGHDLQDQSIVGTYKTTINQMVKQYSIGTGATCIAEATLPNYRKIIEEPDNRGNMKERWFSKTHEELKDDIEKAIDECKNQAAEAILVILILERHSIPVYSAFKDAADRVSAMQNLCVTAEKNRGKPVGDRNLLQYFANVMMKVNLKCGGRNHTVCDNDNNLVKDQGRLSDILNPGVPKRSTMILGADVTHPGGGSLIGCPSVAALVGSIDSEAGKFLGSMRIQNKSKKEVSTIL
jgi:eukaryotic translation initiation factor 2C